MTTLSAFQHQKVFRAEKGGQGRGKEQYGRKGRDIEILVPCGTVVWQYESGGQVSFRGELVEDGQRLLVAKGGREGRGNAAFATATQQAPYIAEKGERAQERRYRLELRLLADVGIIGKPNAGKSTLLRAASGAKPKIADYPFTTLEPVLGVVEVEWERFVLAEIPGLIEGAYRGTGLGHAFLRHAARTRLLLHLVDGTVTDVGQALREVNEELRAHGEGLPEKPQIVVVNKLDLPEVRERREEIERSLARLGSPVSCISAETGEGVAELMAQTAAMLRRLGKEKVSEKTGARVATERSSSGRVVVTREMTEEGPRFVVSDEQAERLVAGSDLRMWAGRVQLKRQLDRMGVTQALEEAGVRDRDTVRFGEIELEW